MTEKQKIEFSRELNLDSINEDGDLVELDRSTLLVPGVHNGVKFTEDEIKKMDFSNSFPLNLDHDRDIGKEVGFWKNPNIEGDKLRADPVLNRQTAAFDIAMGYVQNRKAMDGTAEVSIEVFGIPDENEDGEEIFTELELDKASLVDRGAVSPDKGAGIGMQMDENFTWIIDGDEVECGIETKDGNIVPVQKYTDDEIPEIEEIEEEDEGEEVELYVPNNPDNYDTSEADWEAPTLSDFTDDSFDDLSESEKRAIAAHFAFSMNNPPETFGDLKLPHHAPSSSNVVKNGVESAMAALNGARGGVEGVSRDDKEAIHSHLKSHYVDDFDVDPSDVPELKSSDEEPEDFKREEIKVDKEHYEELQSEVIKMRNEVQELQEKLGEEWTKEIENDENPDASRKTAVNGDSEESTNKETLRKLVRGELV